MEQSLTNVRTSEDRSVSVAELDALREEQGQYGEGTLGWTLLEDRINQIIAENYLRYVNR